MADYDIEHLLARAEGEDVYGEDISYDPDFLALEADLTPKTGDILGEDQTPEEPKWADIADKCFDLLKRSKDLRVAMYFALAMLKKDSIKGFSVGLKLLDDLCDRFWDGLHPKLDPDDNNDPLERINILVSLSPPGATVQDPFKFKQSVTEVPLTDSRQMGKFSFRDIQIARGTITLPEGQKDSAPESSVIDAAFKDTDAGYLQELFEACESSIESLESITRTFEERAFQGQSPDLSDMITIIKKIRLCLQEYLAQLGVTVVNAGGIEMGPEGIPEVSATLGAAFSGDVRSPQDAIAVLDKVSRYFERNEPSSPVPLLLKRAKKLISKDFMELINDLCPDAIRQIEMISGSTSEDSASE